MNESTLFPNSTNLVTFYVYSLVLDGLPAVELLPLTWQDMPGTNTKYVNVGPGVYIYVLYVDANTFFLFGQVNPTPLYTMGLLVKNGGELNAESLMDKLLTQVSLGALNELSGQYYQGSKAPILVKDYIFTMSWLYPDLNGMTYIKKSLRPFTESQIVPLNFTQYNNVNNIFNLRYSNDVSRPFDSQMIINDPYNPALKLRTLRFVGQNVTQNISDYHTFNSNKIFRTLGILPRTAPNVVNQYSEVVYLYVSSNYIITYEYDQANSNNEYLRLYERQGLNGTVAQFNTMLTSMPGYILVLDLVGQMRDQYLTMSPAQFAWAQGVLQNLATLLVYTLSQLVGGLLGGLLGGLGFG